MDKILNKIKRFIPRKIFRFFQPAYHFFFAWLAAAIYRWPSEKMIVIGITGTTGKTTTAYLVAKTLQAAGFKVGLSSTAVFMDGKKEWLNDKKMTMVGRIFTQKLMHDMVKNGCQYAVIETTSEGVVQFRHRFINYDILVFTGLYPEHIESHGSFEKYKEAKGRLFAHLSTCRTKYINAEHQVTKKLPGIKKLDFKRVKKTIIVNGDDEHCDYFLSFRADKRIVFVNQEGKRANDFELKEKHILRYGGSQATAQGTSFTVGGGESIKLQLLGAFNVINAMAAYSVAYTQHVDAVKIKSGLESIAGVAGRLERIDEGQDFAVIVDYAFEPNAVKKLYEAINLFEHNRIIHVLGATGGGRDIARRPILGHLAGANAQIVIVTNEDPYDDDPELIIDQVALGVEQEGKKYDENLFKITDRGEAIKKAIQLATAGDIVLITGKGSEQAICVAGGGKIPWDDREMARKCLRLNH